MLSGHTNEHDAERCSHLGGAREEFAHTLGHGVGRDVIVGRVLAEQGIANAAAGKVRHVAVVSESADDPDRAGACFDGVRGSGHAREVYRARAQMRHRKLAEPRAGPF